MVGKIVSSSWVSESRANGCDGLLSSMYPCCLLAEAERDVSVMLRGCEGAAQTAAVGRLHCHGLSGYIHCSSVCHSHPPDTTPTDSTCHAYTRYSATSCVCACVMLYTSRLKTQRTF